MPDACRRELHRQESGIQDGVIYAHTWLTVGTGGFGAKDN